ncbi:MAG: tripartite tricarboxylate transporter TctB family protein [Rhizobiaceae bacterium]
MRKTIRRAAPEVLTIATLLVTSVLALVFINYLVEPPKLLFGRSLTAIEPSLFPLIVLALLAGLCAILMWMMRTAGAETADSVEDLSGEEWRRGMAFFAIMICYALTMAPFGFLIASAIAMIAMSLLMGTRSILQIICVSVIGPMLLYLAATRLLAVALPELNAIEVFYARLLGE